MLMLINTLPSSNGVWNSNVEVGSELGSDPRVLTWSLSSHREGPGGESEQSLCGASMGVEGGLCDSLTPHHKLGSL